MSIQTGKKIVMNTYVDVDFKQSYLEEATDESA